MGTLPDYEKFWGVWSKLTCLSKRYKSIFKGVKRYLMAEQRCTTIISVAAVALSTFSGISGSGLGGASLEAAIGHLKMGLGAVVRSFRDVVFTLGRVKVATCEVVSDSRAIREELVGLSRLADDQVFDMKGSVLDPRVISPFG